MKILIVNAYDILGGAARATYRLHRALLECGIDSKMLVQIKRSDDYTVIGPETKLKKALGMIRPTLDQLPLMFYKRSTKTPFSPSWLPFSGVISKIKEIRPDIVHLHWICGGMLRIEDIGKIKVPIVWTLHDNWAFTGGCHYIWDCEKYKSNCGACPQLGSSKENDLSRKVWLRKKKTFNKITNITIVAPSKWLAQCAKESSLLKNKNIVNIPNLLDTNLFKPFEKNSARDLWNLPKDKKFVLFGAVAATRDVRKGFKELTQALKQLKLRREDIELIVFGSSKPPNDPDFGFKSHYLGHLYDDISLVTLYNAADVVVVPSLQENLSNVIMESLSCGTPVVAFDIGGNGDMIEHKVNGYLAKPFDPEDLARGIEWVLNNPNYQNLSNNAREKVLREFDSKVVVKKYIELYKEILRY